MRPPTLMLTVLLVLVAVPVTMTASQAGGPAGALVRPVPKSGWDADKKTPYSRLFNPAHQPFAQTPATPSPAVAGQAEAKCGMTLIPADPSLDPLIAISRPPAGTTFTIRALPPGCR